MANKILRLPNVTSMTGLSRSTIYLLISKGVFPKAINLNSRAVGWLESDVEAWLSERVHASRQNETLTKQGK